MTRGPDIDPHVTGQAYPLSEHLMTWPLVPLERLVLLNPNDDHLRHLSDDSLVSFVPMNAVSEDGLGIANRIVKPFVDVRRGYSTFKDNDVLFAKITPCMENGKCALATSLVNGRGFGSTEFHVLRTGPAILPAFLHYFVSQKSFRAHARRHMRGGVGQQRVPSDFLLKELIPLPPPIEQARIVDILDQADRLRRLPATADAISDRVLPALFIKMFGNPSTNPRGWQTRPLGEITEHLTSGSRGWAKYTGTGKASFVRTQDVANGLISPRLLSLDPPPGAESERTRLTTGDVVVTITGIVGKAAVVRDSRRQLYVSQHVALVRPRKSALLPEYLSAYANLPLGDTPVLARFQYGQTKPGLGFRELKTARIHTPPLRLQREFSEHAKALRRQRASTEGLQDSMQTLWSAILHRAFSSRLSESWRRTHISELIHEVEQQSKKPRLSRTVSPHQP